MNFHDSSFKFNEKRKSDLFWFSVMGAFCTFPIIIVNSYESSLGDIEIVNGRLRSNRLFLVKRTGSTLIGFTPRL